MSLANAIAAEKELAKKNIAFEIVTEYEQVDRLSTGSLTFDWILGGGIPLRRTSILWGWESYGKTTLATQIASHTLKTDPDAVVYYVDVEHAYDRKWGENIGIDDPNRFRLAQPETSEHALEGIARLIEKGAGKLFILDSLAGMITSEEAEKNIGQNTVGTRATEIQHFFRKVTPILKKSDSALLVINQVREKIGAMGDPEVMPGGNAVKFYNSITIKLNQPHYLIPNPKEAGELTKKTTKPYGEDVKGFVFRPKVTKNKTAKPFREGEITFMIDPVFGVDVVSEIADLGKRYGVFVKEDGSLIESGGAWHFEGTRLGVGKDAAKSAIRANPELFEKTLMAVREAMLNEQ